MEKVCSIIHRAYGDCYEQMICLRYYKRTHPEVRLALFFASEARRKELQVFDLSFADEVHPAAAIPQVPLDRFFQFQIRDDELQQGILSKLPGNILAKMDLRRHLKTWSMVRTIFKQDSATCDLDLGPWGRQRLPGCLEESGLDESIFERRFTVGFLWRHRRPGSHVSTWCQTPEETVLRTKSE